MKSEITLDDARAVGWFDVFSPPPSPQSAPIRVSSFRPRNRSHSPPYAEAASRSLGQVRSHVEHRPTSDVMPNLGRDGRLCGSSALSHLPRRNRRFSSRNFPASSVGSRLPHLTLWAQIVR
jgi:hypothetical protein